MEEVKQQDQINSFDRALSHRCLWSKLKNVSLNTQKCFPIVDLPRGLFFKLFLPCFPETFVESDTIAICMLKARIGSKVPFRKLHWDIWLFHIKHI